MMLRALRRAFGNPAFEELKQPVTHAQRFRPDDGAPLDINPLHATKFTPRFSNQELWPYHRDAHTSSARNLLANYMLSNDRRFLRDLFKLQAAELRKHPMVLIRAFDCSSSMAGVAGAVATAEREQFAPLTSALGGRAMLLDLQVSNKVRLPHSDGLIDIGNAPIMTEANLTLRKGNAHGILHPGSAISDGWRVMFDAATALIESGYRGEIRLSSMTDGVNTLISAEGFRGDGNREKRHAWQVKSEAFLREAIGAVNLTRVRPLLGGYVYAPHTERGDSDWKSMNDFLRRLGLQNNSHGPITVNFDRVTDSAELSAAAAEHTKRTTQFFKVQ